LNDGVSKYARCGSNGVVTRLFSQQVVPIRPQSGSYPKQRERRDVNFPALKLVNRADLDSNSIGKRLLRESCPFPFQLDVLPELS
jgi:hypothetical protein